VGGVVQRGQEQEIAAAEFSRLLDRIQTAGAEVIRPAAVAVDRDARFPQEAIEALQELRLLSAYVPPELGGMGLDIAQLAKLCEVLGQYDGSVAMIYAMHQIQVACIVHHASQTDYFRGYLDELVRAQRLIASATTEVGTGGDLRSSVCALDVRNGRFNVEKKAPVISYGAAADDILVTCRRSPDAAASDQVAVLAQRGDFRLDTVSGWDTLGFRGTCSSGFVLTASGSAEQVLPAAFRDVLARTMHPVSHILWGSLWLGIAIDALNRARRFVRAEARRNPGMPPTSALRLAEADSALQAMRSNIATAVAEYQRISSGAADAFDSFDFAVRTNNLKLACSTLVVDVVSRAMLMCGIEGYRNDSQFSLCRQLRDAYGAALMVNNDRILNHNAAMLLAQREG
jgi:acyl-CoA dehydrogenase